PQGANLNISRDAHADDATFSSRRFLLCAQLCVINYSLSLVERSLVIPAVILQARGGVKWEFGWSREVLPPNFRSVHAQLQRDKIHGAFNDIGCFRPACTAVSIGGHLVSEACGYIDLNRRDSISAGKHQARQGRNRRSQQLMIGSQICEHVVAQASDGAIVLAADFNCANLTSTVDGRLNIFATSFYPLHRLAELHRDPPEQRFFSINI